MRNYTRWTESADGHLEADLIGMRFTVAVHPVAGKVVLHHHDEPMPPDEARMLGVRLIEAAALADGHRAIRSAPRPRPLDEVFPTACGSEDGDGSVCVLPRGHEGPHDDGLDATWAGRA